MSRYSITIYEGERDNDPLNPIVWQVVRHEEEQDYVEGWYDHLEAAIVAVKTLGVQLYQDTRPASPAQAAAPEPEPGPPVYFVLHSVDQHGNPMFFLPGGYDVN